MLKNRENVTKQDIIDNCDVELPEDILDIMIKDIEDYESEA